MSGKVKKVIGTIVILVAAAGITGYFMWNKPHVNVAGAEAIKIDAVALYKAFATDSVAAQKKYLQQIVAVSGTINSTAANQQGKMIVLIKTAADGAYINCTLEEQAGSLKEGNTVTIKGICSGLGQADADLGIKGDLYLVRCYLVK